MIKALRRAWLRFWNPYRVAEKELDDIRKITADPAITGAVKRETHRLRRREHLKKLAYKNGWGLLELESFAKNQFGSPGGLTWSLNCYSDSQIEQLIAAFEAEE